QLVELADTGNYGARAGIVVELQPARHRRRSIVPDRPIPVHLEQRRLRFDHSGGLSQPGLMGDRSHRGLIDDSDRIPRKHGVTGLGSIHSGWNSHLELLRQPGEGAVATKADTMILTRVRFEPYTEPSRAAIGGAPGRLYLIGGNADLNWPGRDRTLE